MFRGLRSIHFRDDHHKFGEIRKKEQTLKEVLDRKLKVRFLPRSLKLRGLKGRGRIVTRTVQQSFKKSFEIWQSYYN